MAIVKVDSNLLDKAIYENNEACGVIFSRKDCPVCKEVVPKVEEVFKNYESECSLYYVDVEESKDIFKKFKLKGVPQVLFFNNGEFYGKLAGDMEEEDLEEKIEEVIRGEE